MSQGTLRVNGVSIPVERAEYTPATPAESRKQRQAEVRALRDRMLAQAIRTRFVEAAILPPVMNHATTGPGQKQRSSRSRGLRRLLDRGR